MRRIGMFFCLWLVGSDYVAADSVYRCTVEGVMTFSQQPCAEDAQRVEVDYIRPAAGAAVEQEARSRRTEESNRQMTRERRMREIGYEIENAADSVQRLQRQRDKEIAQLRRKRARASNNLAGATWEKSIAQEMAVVNQRYDSLIAQHQTDIDRWREDLRSLRAQ